MANAGIGDFVLGLFGVMGVVNVVLKLCGVISWPWWLVLAPIWVPITLLLLVWVALVLTAMRK